MSLASSLLNDDLLSLATQLHESARESLRSREHQKVRLSQELFAWRMSEQTFNLLHNQDQSPPYMQPNLSRLTRGTRSKNERRMKSNHSSRSHSSGSSVTPISSIVFSSKLAVLSAYLHRGQEQTNDLLPVYVNILYRLDAGFELLF